MLKACSLGLNGGCAGNCSYSSCCLMYEDTMAWVPARPLRGWSWPGAGGGNRRSTVDGGWVDAAGLRRFRESLLFVPRKNGKTTLAAGVILYMLFEDGESGAEVYGAGSEYQQASLVFHHCRGMIARSRHVRVSISG